MGTNLVRWDLNSGIWSNPIQERRQIKRQQQWRCRIRAAVKEKPASCTADELHYVAVPNNQWQLALWRYLPSPQAPMERNHPLLLLSGIGTTAVGYDLSPQASFARHMSGQGFDTWILEVRGAGLSTRELESAQSTSRAEQSSIMGSTVPDWVRGVSNFVEETRTYIPRSLPVINEHLTPTVQEFQKQLDVILNSDWDFDQYLKEDLPLVMDYIRTQSQPSDGKLLAIGHSMGGILLYAMLSLCAFERRDSRLAAITTLASSLDYSSSNSSLRLILPLVNPAEALNIPAIPIGPIIRALYPLAARPPFLLSWLNAQISAQGMMLPQLYEKLIHQNFCTIPAKLLLQLATVFQRTGLSDRSGTFFYKEHLPKSNVPILAIAGDQDLICPSEAVYETVKTIPENVVTYRVFGEPEGPHYGHYDLVGGRFVAKEVYPCIIDFLNTHDRLDTDTPVNGFDSL